LVEWVRVVVVSAHNIQNGLSEDAEEVDSVSTG
jgi:hypothetical protein